MPTIAITGGTGMIGQELTRALLERDHQVIIISRSDHTTGDPPRSARHNDTTRKDHDAVCNRDLAQRVKYAKWDVEKQWIDKDAITQADYIIHLAGAGVADKRWTKNRKQEIVKSRVDSGSLLADSLKNIPNKVKAVVSASAIGWYGRDPVIPNPHPFKEDAPHAVDFLGSTCKQWEDSLEKISNLYIRLVKLRTGIVFSKKGGAFSEFVKPLRFGVATILGNGRQIISWIHIDDLVQMYIAAIEDPAINGAYNAVAPAPISNREFMHALAKSRTRVYIPMYVPSFVLKLILGEMSTEVLKSATISCEKMQKHGFSFRYPSLANALKALR
jgi:uncharacterized protein (TIGR01777 family)